MNFIRKFYLFILLINYQNICANIALLHIFPSEEIMFDIASEKTLCKYKILTKLAILQGFKTNQVTLVLDKYLGLEAFNYGFFYHNSTEYTPNSLNNALKNGEIDRYPLHFHKQLNYLLLEDHLAIVLYDNKRENPVIINLPFGMYEKILTYLSYDMQNYHRQCFDFFREVFLNLCNNNPDNCSYLKLSELSSDVTFNPGDGVILFRKEIKGLMHIKKIKHYAIALVKGLYLSKAGNGNSLVVQDMSSMLKFWDCDGFFRVNFSDELIYPCIKKERLLERPFFEI